MRIGTASETELQTAPDRFLEGVYAKQEEKPRVSSVKTDSTHPPPGLFKKSAATIARTMASNRVSPKGLGSGMRMLTYFMNRAVTWTWRRAAGGAAKGQGFAFESLQTGEKGGGKEEGRLKGDLLRGRRTRLIVATPNARPHYGEPGIALTGLHADTEILLRHLQEVRILCRNARQLKELEKMPVRASLLPRKPENSFAKRYITCGRGNTVRVRLSKPLRSGFQRPVVPG
jgi:hypothetical protein